MFFGTRSLNSLKTSKASSFAVNWKRKSKVFQNVQNLGFLRKKKNEFLKKILKVFRNC